MSEHRHAAGAARPATLPRRHPDAPAPGEAIASHYALCIGCGPEHPTGLKVAVTAGDGLTVSGTFTVTDDHQGAPGLAHGGMLSLAFDEVLGSLIWLIGKPAVTAHLETDYRRPVPVGTSLRIDAQVDAMAGRKLYMSAVGREDDEHGAVSVTASAVFVVVDGAHFARHGRAADVAAGRLEVNP